MCGSTARLALQTLAVRIEEHWFRHTDLGWGQWQLPQILSACLDRFCKGKIPARLSIYLFLQSSFATWKEISGWDFLLNTVCKNPVSQNASIVAN